MIKRSVLTKSVSCVNDVKATVDIADNSGDILLIHVKTTSGLEAAQINRKVCLRVIAWLVPALRRSVDTTRYRYVCISQPVYF